MESAIQYLCRNVVFTINYSGAAISSPAVTVRAIARRVARPATTVSSFSPHLATASLRGRGNVTTPREPAHAEAVVRVQVGPSARAGPTWQPSGFPLAFPR